jgi:hypothetical protein
MRASTFLSSAALAALLLPTAAHSQTPPSPSPSAPSTGRTTQYEASFFAPFAPRSALDIVRRVPGFNLELGDTEVRGFAGAVGNVVINNARPSSKSESLEAVLSRIPASRVIRVEVGPGDLYGADYAGKGQVLNLILSAVSGLDGQVTASATRRYTGEIVPNGEATVLLKRGDSSFNLSAGTGLGNMTEEGSDSLFDAVTGDLLEYRRKINTIRPRNPFIAGSWALEQGDNNAIHLNARFAPTKFKLTQTSHVEPSIGGEIRDDFLIHDYDNPTIEVGGDISRPLGDGAIKFVGLATRRKRDNFDAQYFRGQGGSPPLGGFEQFQNAKLQETIGRLSYSRPALLGFSFESGLEIAYNKLDANIDLYLIDDEGTRSRLDLPIDDAVVSELRGELYFNGGRPLASNLRVDLGLRYEMSRLEVRGDAVADRELRFIKPSIALDWRPGNGWHAQASLRRIVAQLDFYDFISAAELASDRVSGGNAELLPQRSWQARALVERPVLGDGRVKVEIGYDLVSMLQDRVLVFDEDGNGFDAPGNLGTGRRAFVDFSFDAPLSKLGLTGIRWNGNFRLQRTRVEDPIWGVDRRWSGFYPWFQWFTEVRRDSGAFSYGFGISDRAQFTFFRTDEIDSNRNLGPYATAFAEYRPDSRTTVRLDADNVLDTRAERERILHRPNRTSLHPQFVELRERNMHVSFGLSVKRSFGGGAGASGN